MVQNSIGLNHFLTGDSPTRSRRDESMVESRSLCCQSKLLRDRIDGDHRLHTTRKRRLSDVCAAIDRLGLNEGLRGSWKHGDFHLTPCGTISFSDLDLVATGATTGERRSIATALSGQIGRFLRIRVSVHPEDYFISLSTEDTRIMVIAECLAMVLHQVSSGSVTADYVRAKGSLLALRRDPRERYRDVSKRLDSPAARLALDVKMGRVQRFDESLCRQFLHLHGGSQAVELADRCLCGSIESKFIAELTNRVAALDSVPLWLKKHIMSKMRGISP